MTFEQIQSVAIDLHISKLLDLRSILAKLRLSAVFYEPEIYEELFLDYEAFLYRQSFTLISQKNIWKAIVEIATQLKNKKTLKRQEIYRICSAQEKFNELRKEITLFHSNN